MSGVWQDFREVYRSLRRAPSFTLLCAVILGVGVGLSTAVYTAFNAVLLRPLPVTDESRIVVGWGRNAARDFAHVPLYMSQWRAFVDQSRTIQAAAAVDYNGAWPWVMRDGSAAYPVKRGLVTGGFFAALGSRPHLGRLLNADDDRVGSRPVSVISYGFWQRRFGADTSVIGRQLTMHATGVQYTVVGVAPRGLDYPTDTEMWVPLVPATTYAPADTSSALVDVVGRLRPGATARDAAEELTVFFRRDTRTVMQQSRGTMITLHELILGDVSREFTVLAIAVALLLLVACMNVGGLMMMRGTQQSRTVALRMAVGASQGRIVRWHFIEGAVLAAAGWMLGAGLAYSALGALGHYAPAQLPRLDEIRPDAVALLVAAAISAMTAILFATGPALLAGRVDAATLLRAGAVNLSASRRVRRAREGLVIAQVAAAVVVLSTAALLLRSFRELQRAELGFEDANVMVVDLGWDFTQVKTAARSLAIYDALLPRLQSIPGLESASALLLTPFGATAGWDVIIVAADRPSATQQQNPYLNMEVVSPTYFDVFRVPLKQGRVMTDSDREGAENVVVLSESAARSLWPDEPALGKRLALASRVAEVDAPQWTVVGIVADTRYRDFRAPRATIYFPHHQPPFELAATMLAVRATSDPLALLPAIRTALQETAPEVVVGQAATMSAHLDRPLAQPRFNAMLLLTFALSTLLVAGVGLYAVLAFSVRLRSREFAIRASVGATPAALRMLVLRSAALLVGGGMALGLAVVSVGGRAMRSMLFGITPLDPVSIALGLGSLLGIASFALLLPARWAGRASAEQLRIESP